jgi:hypothetical protein
VQERAPGESEGDSIIGLYDALTDAVTGQTGWAEMYSNGIGIEEWEYEAGNSFINKTLRSRECFVEFVSEWNGEIETVQN